MEINIRKVGKYNNVEIKLDNTTVDLSLHNEDESLSMATNFIIAAEALLPQECNLYEKFLEAIREVSE